MKEHGRTYVRTGQIWPIYQISKSPYFQLSSIANHTLSFWPSAKKAVDGKNYISQLLKGVHSSITTLKCDYALIALIKLVQLVH